MTDWLTGPLAHPQHQLQGDDIASKKSKKEQNYFPNDFVLMSICRWSDHVTADDGKSPNTRHLSRFSRFHFWFLLLKDISENIKEKLLWFLWNAHFQFNINVLTASLLSRPTRWYWYLDVYVDHLYIFPNPSDREI